MNADGEEAGGARLGGGRDPPLPPLPLPLGGGGPADGDLEGGGRLPLRPGGGGFEPGDDEPAPPSSPSPDGAAAAAAVGAPPDRGGGVDLAPPPPPGGGGPFLPGGGGPRALPLPLLPSTAAAEAAMSVSPDAEEGGGAALFLGGGGPLLLPAGGGALAPPPEPAPDSGGGPVDLERLGGGLEPDGAGAAGAVVITAAAASRSLGLASGYPSVSNPLDGGAADGPFEPGGGAFLAPPGGGGPFLGGGEPAGPAVEPAPSSAPAASAAPFVESPLPSAPDAGFERGGGSPLLEAGGGPAEPPLEGGGRLPLGGGLPTSAASGACESSTADVTSAEGSAEPAACASKHNKQTKAGNEMAMKRAFKTNEIGEMYPGSIQFRLQLASCRSMAAPPTRQVLLLLQSSKGIDGMQVCRAIRIATAASTTNEMLFGTHLRLMVVAAQVISQGAASLLEEGQQEKQKVHQVVARPTSA